MWAAQREAARGIMQRYGAAPQAYFALMPGLSHLFSPAQDAVLGYRVVDGVAIVMRDPAGSDEGIVKLLDAFHELCARHGWRTCFLAATPRLLPTHRGAGLSLLKIGEEALFDLPGLNLDGKSWQDVRTALSRLPREGFSAQWYDLASDPQSWRQRLAAISQEWLAAHGGPQELGFALGTWELAQRFAAEQRMLVLVNADGQPRAFASFIPCYVPGGGWSVDLMRHAAGLPPGAMEFLIATAILQFQAQGCALLSLSLSPLADSAPDESGGDARLLARARRVAELRLGLRYNVRGLNAFKAKFSPRWEARYLAYPGQVQLPRIFLALLKAHGGKA